MPRVIPERDTYYWPEQETTDDYEDLGDPLYKPHYLHTTIVVTNTGDTNDAVVKVCGSVDGEVYIDIEDEQEVGEEESVAFTLHDYWPWVKVQIKSKSASDHTSVTAVASALAL